jgi:hypothetical protein
VSNKQNIAVENSGGVEITLRYSIDERIILNGIFIKK